MVYPINIETHILTLEMHMTDNRLGQVLSHIKVLDLTRARSGPTAVRQLADWGADVLKIETPGADADADLGQRHGRISKTCTETSNL